MEETKEIPANIGQMGIGIQKLIHVQTETIKQGLVGIGNIVKKEGTSSKDAILELQDSISELSDVITTNHEDLMKVFAEEKERKLKKTLGIYYFLLSRSPQTPEAHCEILFDAIADESLTESLFVELLDHLCEGTLEWRHPHQGMVAYRYCTCLHKPRLAAIAELLTNKSKISYISEIDDSWQIKISNAKTPEMEGKVLKSAIENNIGVESIQSIKNRLGDDAWNYTGIQDCKEWIIPALEIGQSNDISIKQEFLQRMLCDPTTPFKTLSIVIKLFGGNLELLFDEETLENLKLGENLLKTLILLYEGCNGSYEKSIEDQYNLRLNLCRFGQEIYEKMPESSWKSINILLRHMMNYLPPKRKEDVDFNKIIFDHNLASGVDIWAHGRTLKCKSGATGACLNVGISTGKITWTIYFRSGSNVFFGVSQPPQTWIHNNKSKSLAHLVDLNGRLYAYGDLKTEHLKRVPKVGVHLRFELDMDFGSCKYFIEEEYGGMICEGLSGIQYPYVSFKGSSGQVVILTDFEWTLSTK
eukprot:TRINITY_DN10148_c0_g1_i4.p1 TRINITY_DN10148_c0_g1~~TRINITY_DN10148_c0_g1_i4.p1  ORF type:complete len:529 (+),score=104.48 TRINITY_DN10148_c0_g1_i4:87-1673(+)